MSESDISSLTAAGEALSRYEGPGTPWIHVRPKTAEQLSSLLREASEAGIGVIASRPGALPTRSLKGPLTFLDLSALASVREHCLDDQVITVEGGMSMQELDLILAKHRQWWPAFACYGESTIADVINYGEGGCLEHGFGGPRDLVLGLSVALASGEIIKCGGKVVKNVTGYDLQKLFVGSRGWLGVILEASLRLFARPQAARSLAWTVDEPGHLLEAAGKLLRSGLPLSCLELADARLWNKIKNRQGTPASDSKETILPERCGFGVLLIQVHGQEAAVGEVVERAQLLLGDLLEPATVLPDLFADRVWSDLSACLVGRLSPPCPADSGAVVEICLPAGRLEELWQFFGQEGRNLSWQARPGRGRLKVMVDGAPAMLDLLQLLQSCALRWAEPLVVAYCDDDFDFRVDTLPVQDEQGRALKQQIKERFDPKRCLNPLVSL